MRRVRGMNTTISRVGLLIVVGVAIVSTLLTGAYYHNEIAVLLKKYLGVNLATTNNGVPSNLPPTPVVSSESFLKMSTLNEPLPLVYSDTLEEQQLQEYLKQGAVVLPLGTTFGEPGNVVVTAHSSGTAAFGEYRFAFARLSELEAGQEFTIATPQATYTYKVYAKEIVWPHQVDKLPNDDRSTVTLVTCWPLWTNFKRLLVHSELVKEEPI